MLGWALTFLIVAIVSGFMDTPVIAGLSLHLSLIFAIVFAVLGRPVRDVMQNVNAPGDESA